MRPGLRDELITSLLAGELAAVADRAERENLDPAEAANRLSRHIAVVVERALSGISTDDPVADQVELTNRLTAELDPDSAVGLPPEVLLGIRPEATGGLAVPQLPRRPEIPFSTSDLLFNGTDQPTMGSELRAELESAERVDLICAFVIWSGVRVLKDQLAGVIERGGRVRVITTTYMGATEPKALNTLIDLGVEVRVAFDARTTKLHAKSWILERPGGLTTAFVGSSNLSHTALHEGLEWNVRLATADAPRLIERIRATFASHWADDHFEPYTHERETDLRRALGDDDRRRSGDASVAFVALDVHPFPYQRRILEALTIERERHERHRNLVVAATGTGKTIVAALDYRGLRQKAGGDLSLLFVAHREQILTQSLGAFRAVMRDGSFGEILGGGNEPLEGQHVFAMVQSLDAERVTALAPDRYDVVIVDEFHHAKADSYARLLDHLKPRELVGLTATPERMDGQDVTEWFGGRVAYELRLWEAIDQGFLAPFQYFGVSDNTDLSQLEWRRGGYVTRDLANLLTGDTIRVTLLVQALTEIVDDVQTMKALGFCVSVEHAEFMAARFNAAGIASVAISGQTPVEDRNAALGQLRDGKLRVVFSVDVLGEGVDVPTVDTLILLRPTQSSTVLTQQLGRGLRLAEGKRCLTVVDMIGQQHRQFRFDQRMRALLDPRRGSVRKQVEENFPLLPAGCDVSLDKVARNVILDNLKDAARLGRWPVLVEDLRDRGDISLRRFLDETGRGPVELYSQPSRSWTALRREAGLNVPAPASDRETTLLRAVGRLLHVDDRERVDLYRDVLAGGSPPRLADFDPRQQRLLAMLHYGLWGVRPSDFDSFDEGFARLWPHETARNELVELLGVLDEASNTITHPHGLDPRIALATHATYSRDEAVAAMGLGNARKPPQVREGVRLIKEANTDAFFVTLHKSDKDYSPTTMYQDYAISRDHFHWESQSITSEASGTGQRYINHALEGSNVVIFVRERLKVDGRTAPYLCLGPATYVEHEGERPMAITWKLHRPMPESAFEAARAVAAA